MKEHLQSVVTLFSLVNPMICVLMFTNLTAGRSSAQRAADATRAILVVAAVLVIAAFLGARILGVFGISLHVFSVAGGLVLSFIGFNMLTGSGTDKPGQNAGAADPSRSGAALAPMILFAASPGTITAVITVAAVHSGTGLPVTALVGIGIVLGFTWLLLIATARKTAAPKANGSNLARDMMSRYMGLIVIAMGIQFALTGYKAFMAA